MRFAAKFTEINKDNTDMAGGKGASLGEMIQAGIPVPDGFVVLSKTFAYFLQETDLTQEIDSILEKVDNKAIHTIEEASEKIRGLVESKDIPTNIAGEIKEQFKNLKSDFVAVRSSATAEDSSEHAWAGQLESFLNTTESNFLENVRKCWSSLFTPRAIFYRFEKGLHNTKISVAVAVQKMVQSEMSGIAFSVHPITEDPNQLIIEAGYGLGEAIVSGSITPDSYVIEKQPRRIIDKNINTQTKGLFRNPDGGSEWKEIPEPKASSQVLTESQILELADLILKIENHYGFPVDVEWALEKGSFYIVQSRPITTLTNRLKQQDSGSYNPEDYQRLFQVGGMPYVVSDTFVAEYKKIKGLVILGNDVWTSYLPKNSIEETLKEGLKIYSDKEEFKKYREGFNNYRKESKEFFEKLIKKDVLNRDELEIFLNYTSGLFFYYRKTEFFATDDAYEHSLKDNNTAENLKHLEEIKNSGREYLNKIFFGRESYTFKTLQIIGKQFNVSVDTLLLYRRDELLNLFDNNKVPDSSLENRKNAYLMAGDGKEIKYLEGEEAKKIVSKFYKSAHEFYTEIKGKTANKGAAVGKAKVITADYGNFDSLHKLMDEMEKGDVLVAETTSPELMPACSKASAIITNQGGMMSHAAIVSREMGIPCIVGTGNATDLIKDGDKVRVDADNGLVRIIKN